MSVCGAKDAAENNQIKQFCLSVPPKINPFHSTILSLNVGDRASITCSVIKGDTPLNVKWLKNGVLIDPSQRISITQVDQYNSILVIEHLSASHSGNYSCVVSNPAAEVESTQALLVNGKETRFESLIEKRDCGEARGATRRKILENVELRHKLIEEFFYFRDS